MLEELLSNVLDSAVLSEQMTVNPKLNELVFQYNKLVVTEGTRETIRNTSTGRELKDALNELPAHDRLRILADYWGTAEQMEAIKKEQKKERFKYRTLDRLVLLFVFIVIVVVVLTSLRIVNPDLIPVGDGFSAILEVLVEIFKLVLNID